MASAPPCAHSLGHPLSPRACAMERVVFESLPMRRTLLMGGSWFWVLMITAAHQLKRSFPIAVDRNKKNDRSFRQNQPLSISGLLSELPYSIPKSLPLPKQSTTTLWKYETLTRKEKHFWCFSNGRGEEFELAFAGFEGKAARRRASKRTHQTTSIRPSIGFMFVAGWGYGG